MKSSRSLPQVFVTCFLFGWVPTLGLADENKDANKITYYKDVRPILRKHCTICHNNQSLGDLETSGGVSLSTPEAILKDTKHPLLTKNKPNASSLYTRLVTTQLDKRMPKDGEKLSDKEIGILKTWIEQGAIPGEPTKASIRRPTGPIKFRDLSIPINVVPPKGVVSKSNPSALSLVAKIDPMLPVTALAFDKQNRFLAAGTFRRVVVWNLKQGKVETVLSDPLGNVHVLKFSPDGKTLWMGGGAPAEQGELRAYDTNNWKMIYLYDEPLDVVFDLDIRPNGKQLACVGLDRYLRVLDISKPDKIKETKALKAHADFVYGLRYSKDGSQIVTGCKDRSIKVWDANTIQSVRAITGQRGEVRAVAFSPDAKKVYAAGSDRSIWVWNLSDTTRRERESRGHRGTITDMDWNAAGSAFATSSTDRSVRLWTADATRSTLELKGPTDVLYSVALNPAGTMVAAGGWDGKVYLWNIPRRTLVMTLAWAGRNDDEQVDWVALSSTGQVNASAQLGDRAHWLMGKEELKFDKVTPYLKDPQAIAGIFQGKLPAKPSFAKKK